MTTNIDDIKALKQYYTAELYSKVRIEQEADETYINDTFPVPEIKSPHTVLRAGLAKRAVDAPAEQIVTSNPQAFVHVLKGSKEKGDRIAKLLNTRWIKILKRQNPNPFKEFVKNCFARGESYIETIDSYSWIANDRTGLPILFLVDDPMIIYGSAEQDENGRPKTVIIYCPRSPAEVRMQFPDWSNPEHKGVKEHENEKKKVEWLEWWTKDERYFEADGEPVLKSGIQPNIYKRVPFVRKYSGFGKRSKDGDLSSLIVSDIRYSRDLIREECAVRSDIASIMHYGAHPKIDLILPTGTKVNEQDVRNNYNMAAGSFNILTLPPGTKPEEGIRFLPSAEAFNHLYKIQADILDRHPFVKSGFPQGESGRQQDMSNTAAMRRYDTVVENAELAFATAFEDALYICKTIPGLFPDDLKKEDLDDIEFEIEVKLKAADPLEEDRKATLGSRLLAQNEIDPITNLVEFKGYTKEQAMDIMVDIMAWKVMMNSPDINELIGLRAIEKAGMTEDIEYIKQRRLALEQQQKALAKQPTPSMAERTQGETQTPMGREMIDMALSAKGQRQSPERYTRE